MSRDMRLVFIPKSHGGRNYRRTGSARAALSLLFAWAAQTLGVYADTQLLPISPDGSKYELHVAAHAAENAPIVSYFRSSGRSSAAIEVAVEGPTGLRGAAFGALHDPERLDEQLRVVPWQLQTRMKIRSELGITAKEYHGFVIAREGGNGTMSFLYHAQKDACAPERAEVFHTGVWFDLSGISPDLRATGFTIRLAMREHQFQGARVASIKPASDGKYRGEPILLMGAVQYGGEYVNVVRRSRAGVRSTRRIPVVKYVSYKGYTLSLARLRNVLRGGRATFELTNGGLIYGVCFELRRRRQVANGYPLSGS